MTPDERRRRRQHEERDFEEDSDLGPLALHIKYLRRDVDNCVTRDEFTPVKTLVYGMVTIIMTSLIGGIITGWILWKK